MGKQSTQKNWLDRLRYSLKARLIATFVVLAFFLVVVFVSGMQRGLSTSWREAVRPLVVDYAQRLFDEIGSPPSVERAQAIAQRLPISVRISGPQINWSSQTDDLSKDDKPIVYRRNQAHDAEDEDALNTRLTADGHRLELGFKSKQWRERPRRIGWFTLGGLLVLITLGYFAIRRALRPIDAIRAGTQRIGKGQFDQPIANTGKDELGDLARDVNTMGERIESMLEAKRSLLLAMSHELRSPLTRARLNSELLPETGESATPRAALLRDLQEMAELIDHLLESEKLNQSYAEGQVSSALLIESIDIKQLLHRAVDKLAMREPIASTILIDTQDDLGVWPLDTKRIEILLRNVLENAIRHGTSDRAPIVSASIVKEGSDQTLVIGIRDFGVGVAASEIEQLSLAFWRIDTSRTRTSGGVGLGLYLSSLVAQAHGGRLTFKRAEPGLEVIITIPKF
jgi:signal transduction histidine kinase